MIGVHSSGGNPEVIVDGDFISLVGSKLRPGMVGFVDAFTETTESVSTSAVVPFDNELSDRIEVRPSGPEWSPSEEDVRFVRRCIASKNITQSYEQWVRRC